MQSWRRARKQQNHAANQIGWFNCNVIFARNWTTHVHFGFFIGENFVEFQKELEGIEFIFKIIYSWRPLLHELRANILWQKVQYSSL